MKNSSSDSIILATAKVWVRDSSGNYKLGKALLVSCSQVNFIRNEFSQKLRLSRSKQNIEIQCIVTGFKLPLTFCITTHIAYQPDPEIDISSWNIPANESLDAWLEKLWKLEEVATAADPWTREQHSCERLYLNTVSRNSCGRIVVRLPLKDDPSCLGDSYVTALRRFHAQGRRFEKLPLLKAHYIEFMDEYKGLRNMSVVENPKVNEPHYYIPQHCVLKPTSTTTKLRVVFDASCRTTTQKSLNDLQIVGPTLQAELFILLLRFRLYRYALTADIIKMYRQVVMHEDDRKYQYILWRSSPTEEVSTYQLNTVTYGMASAPYLAIRSK
ncbi:PREDICTED: uncharacterized protein LOC108365671 isoform X2 [Rhagoletis zephyria]|uniref:uncharacterized protein LOC108365671 isoform X2 n=1 Tax=Rhagoletis zephyria TaxID=28612 RepID=UPI00081194E7|nr:PREDICTED: uncharacterized protein LOC108365671 isoform X2 [Rhagoletis zephyria]